MFYEDVDFCLSDTVEDYFSLFRGMRYRDVPDRPYEFIFIDGPKYHCPLIEDIDTRSEIIFVKDPEKLLQIQASCIKLTTSFFGKQL